MIFGYSEPFSKFIEDTVIERFLLPAQWSVWSVRLFFIGAFLLMYCRIIWSIFIKGRETDSQTEKNNIPIRYSINELLKYKDQKSGYFSNNPGKLKELRVVDYVPYRNSPLSHVPYTRYEMIGLETYDTKEHNDGGPHVSEDQYNKLLNKGGKRPIQQKKMNSMQSGFHSNAHSYGTISPHHHSTKPIIEPYYHHPTIQPVSVCAPVLSSIMGPIISKPSYNSGTPQYYHHHHHHPNTTIHSLYSTHGRSIKPGTLTPNIIQEQLPNPKTNIPLLDQRHINDQQQFKSTLPSCSYNQLLSDTHSNHKEYLKLTKQTTSGIHTDSHPETHITTVPLETFHDDSSSSYEIQQQQQQQQSTDSVQLDASPFPNDLMETIRQLVHLINHTHQQQDVDKKQHKINHISLLTNKNQLISNDHHTKESSIPPKKNNENDLTHYPYHYGVSFHLNGHQLNEFSNEDHSTAAPASSNPQCSPSSPINNSVAIGHTPITETSVQHRQLANWITMQHLSPVSSQHSPNSLLDSKHVSSKQYPNETIQLTTVPNLPLSPSDHALSNSNLEKVSLIIEDTTLSPEHYQSTNEKINNVPEHHSTTLITETIQQPSERLTQHQLLESVINFKFLQRHNYSKDILNASLKQRATLPAIWSIILSPTIHTIESGIIKEANKEAQTILDGAIEFKRAEVANDIVDLFLSKNIHIEPHTMTKLIRTAQLCGDTEQVKQLLEIEKNLNVKKDITAVSSSTHPTDISSVSSSSRLLSVHAPEFKPIDQYKQSITNPIILPTFPTFITPYSLPGDDHTQLYTAHIVTHPQTYQVPKSTMNDVPQPSPPLPDYLLTQYHPEGRLLNQNDPISFKLNSGIQESSSFPLTHHIHSIQFTKDDEQTYHESAIPVCNSLLKDDKLSEEKEEEEEEEEAYCNNNSQDSLVHNPSPNSTTLFKQQDSESFNTETQQKPIVFTRKPAKCRSTRRRR